MFKRPRSVTTALLAGLLVLATVIGCGDDDSDSADSGSKIGFVTETTVEFFKCFANGVEAEITAAGNEYVQANVQYDSPGSEVDAAEDLITQQVDAVVYLSVNPKAGPGVFQTFEAEGVPVITVNDDSYLTDEQREQLAGRYVYDLAQLGRARPPKRLFRTVPRDRWRCLRGPRSLLAVEPAPGQGIGGNLRWLHCAN